MLSGDGEHQFVQQCREVLRTYEERPTGALKNALFPRGTARRQHGSPFATADQAEAAEEAESPLFRSKSSSAMKPPLRSPLAARKPAIYIQPEEHIVPPPFTKQAGLSKRNDALGELLSFHHTKESPRVAEPEEVAEVESSINPPYHSINLETKNKVPSLEKSVSEANYGLSRVSALSCELPCHVWPFVFAEAHRTLQNEIYGPAHAREAVQKDQNASGDPADDLAEAQARSPSDPSARRKRRLQLRGLLFNG